MDKRLQKIANMLVLYSYHIQVNGLLNGKMGLILFLYRYAEYSGCKYYQEFSDKLLDNVMESVKQMPVDFEDGLSGIGWTVNHLMKTGLVDGDPNDVLQDVDKKIFSDYNRCNPQTSVFGQGIYLIERLKDNQSDMGFEKYQSECLNFCVERITNYKGMTSLYHINSILFFLLNIENELPENGTMDSIMKNLPEHLKSIFRNQLFNDVDLYIFKRMLSDIGSGQKTRWEPILYLQVPGQSGNFDIETKIRISWQEMLYFGDSRLKETQLDDISRFIDSKHESLAMDDFLFSKGLAGLGNMVLFTNT